MRRQRTACEYGALAEETAARLERIEKQIASQPGAERALMRDVLSVDSELALLTHKARLAAAVQDNLETRSKALRAVLRVPSLWPCGELSVEEERQHRALLALRDRVLEGQRTMHTLIARAAEASDAPQPRLATSPTGGAKAPARPASNSGWRFSLHENGVDGADGEEDVGNVAVLDEETVELIGQGALLQRLVSALRRAKQQGEEALAIAQCVGTG